MAEGYETGANFRCEFLFDAEKDMLAAVDSLSGTDFPPAILKEKDALANLIKARENLKQLLKKPDGQGKKARALSRAMEQQKLRRPKDSEEAAEQLAERLRQLENQEESVCASLSGKTDSNAPANSKQPSEAAGGTTPGKTKPSQPGEQKDSQEQQATGDSEGTDGGRKPGDMDRGQVEELQREIVDEAYDLTQVMAGIEGLSELARTRMDGATEKAEQASSALARGNTPEATEASRQAGVMFGELAEHVEGLLAREAAQRIAKARDMASQLARREQKLGNAAGATPKSQGKSGADQPNGSDQPGSSQQDGQQKGEGQSETGSGGGSRGGVNPDHELRDRAARLAESGRTLEDVLRALAKESDEREPSGAGTAERVARLMDELKVSDTVAQMQQLADQLKGGRHGQVRLEAEDISGQLEILAQRLEAVHRAVVTPRLHELIALEKRAAALREGLKRLESEGDVSQWHRATDLLAQDLEKLSAADRAASDLLEAMHEEGWGGDLDRWGWDRIDDGPYYVGPGSYDRHLGLIIGELQLEARELLLSDLIAAGDESTPPEYKLMVERYFKVLSQEPRNE